MTAPALVRIGIDWCTVHHGTRGDNEGPDCVERRYDPMPDERLATDDEVGPRSVGFVITPRACRLVPLVYLAEGA